MEKPIGACWVKVSKKGEKFLSGEIAFGGDMVKIVLFKNGFKEKESQPDYRIYLSQPKPELNANGTEKANPPVEVRETQVTDDNGIPF